MVKRITRSIIAGSLLVLAVSACGTVGGTAGGAGVGAATGAIYDITKHNN